MCHNDHCHRNHYRHDHTPPRIPPRPSPPKTIHHSYYHQDCNNKEHCNLEDYQPYDHYTVITTASTTIITTTTSIVNMTFMTMMYQSLLKNSQVYIDANMLLYRPELWGCGGSRWLWWLSGRAPGCKSCGPRFKSRAIPTVPKISWVL